MPLTRKSVVVGTTALFGSGDRGPPHDHAAGARPSRHGGAGAGRGHDRLGVLDDIEIIYDDEVRSDVGAVTAPAMRRIETGLRAALGMPD